MEKILELHEASRGVQDRYIEEEEQPKLQRAKNIIGKFIGTREQEAIGNRVSRSLLIGNRTGYVQVHDPSEHVVFCNFRFKEPIRYKYIDLEIGGQRFDRIYSELIPDKRMIPFDHSKYGIPSLFYHEIRLRVHLDTETDQSPILLYDIHKPYGIKKSTFERIFTQNCLLESVDNEKELGSRLRVYGNHPVTKIIGISNPGEKSELKELVLEMRIDSWGSIEPPTSTRRYFKIVVPLTHHKGNIYVYEFPKTINFSRIRDVDIINNKFIRIYSTNLQIENFMEGMGGLVFSK